MNNTPEWIKSQQGSYAKHIPDELTATIVWQGSAGPIVVSAQCMCRNPDHAWTSAIYEMHRSDENNVTHFARL